MTISSRNITEYVVYLKAFNATERGGYAILGITPRLKTASNHNRLYYAKLYHNGLYYAELYHNSLFWTKLHHGGVRNLQAAKKKLEESQALIEKLFAEGRKAANRVSLPVTSQIISFSSVLLSSLELSDTQVYEP